MKNPKIFCAFPGTGKSYVVEHQDEIGLEMVDLDSSLFHWIEQDGKKIENPNFISDYINKITDLFYSKQCDVIFISTHTAVMNELKNREIPFSLIIPRIDTKYTWLDRYRARNNDLAFIQKIETHWEGWLGPLSAMKKDGYEVYELSENTFISDIMYNLI